MAEPKNTITMQGVLEAINIQGGGGEYWIGGHKSDISDSFIWASDGSIVGDDNWAYGFPMPMSGCKNSIYLHQVAGMPMCMCLPQDLRPPASSSPLLRASSVIKIADSSTSLFVRYLLEMGFPSLLKVYILYFSRAIDPLSNARYLHCVWRQ